MYTINFTCNDVSVIFTQQYLAWRVLTGLHQAVKLSFMLVGHTKFAPDWCFGLFKQKYRRTYISSLDDVANTVNSSADVNIAQLVGTQSGEPVVNTYNWNRFLGEHFRSVPHLKKFHHFSFSTQQPGVVTMKEFSDSVGTSFMMLDDKSWCPTAESLLPIITPTGLTLARQWYLYQQIREFCRDGTEDLVCPKPNVPPATNELPQHSDEGDSSGRAVAPTAKRVRRCGNCGNAGHTRRNCKERLLRTYKLCV